MKIHSRNQVMVTGLSIFSMFFGAGNVVFPLTLGQYAQDNNIFAILGLLITAVGVPIFGLLAMTLYEGNFKQFFGRLGPLPGFLFALVLMTFLGPFGALPRCIAFSYATTKMFFDALSVELYSFITCALIFLLAFQKKQILAILGYVLTPILLGLLVIIITKAINFSSPLPVSLYSPIENFFYGLTEGYQTLDLFAAFFFTSIILAALKKDPELTEEQHYLRTLKTVGLGSLIGAALLSFIYIGFSFASANNSEALKDFYPDELLGQMALLTLGPHAGIIVTITVSLACLTTAIALACIFAEYIEKDLSRHKISYIPSLFITLAIAYIFTTMNYLQVIAILNPILQIIYPALILLSVLNVLHKLYRVEPIKGPVLAVLTVSLLDTLLVYVGIV